MGLLYRLCVTDAAVYSTLLDTRRGRVSDLRAGGELGVGATLVLVGCWVGCHNFF